MIDVRPHITDALRHQRPVVALESTLVSHGLPWPVNLDTARRAEAAVRDHGAVPATIAVVRGRPTIGLSEAEIEHLARAGDVRKCSRRDLAIAVARREWAATTVAATMFLAHRAGIRVFATGGIGGVHPGSPPDISADLVELSRVPVCVVCAGAKSILDLPATLELLETLGVPVVGYGTDTFPAFYVESSGLKVADRVDSPGEAAGLLRAHWALDGAGVVLACPLSPAIALRDDELGQLMQQAEEDAQRQAVSGAARTPFLLGRLAELTHGASLRANQELIAGNARVAAQVAVALLAEDA